MIGLNIENKRLFSILTEIGLKMLELINKKIFTQVENKELVKKKHEQIVGGASELFSKKGFHATGMRDIARESGINLSYMYKYISSKDDILYLYYRHIFQIFDPGYKILRDKAYENPVVQLKDYIRSALKATHIFKRELLTLITESRHLQADSLHDVLSTESEIIHSIKAVIDRGVKDGYFKSNDTLIAANIIQLLVVIEALRGWNFLKKYTFEGFEDSIIENIMIMLGVQEVE
jgi:AcrR family transcriptional regulator